MTEEPKRTKRIRQQTAVLLSSVAKHVKEMEQEIYPIPFETLSTDPKWIRFLSDLNYNRHLLMTTTDHYGSPKIKRAKSQSTRLIKVGCSHCGYTTRISQMWIFCAVPVCPNPNCDHKGEPFEVDNIPNLSEEQTFQHLVEKAAPTVNEAEHDPDFERMVKESEAWLDEPAPQPKGEKK